MAHRSHCLKNEYENSWLKKLHIKFNNSNSGRLKIVDRHFYILFGPYNNDIIYNKIRSIYINNIKFRCNGHERVLGIYDLLCDCNNGSIKNGKFVDKHVINIGISKKGSDFHVSKLLFITTINIRYELLNIAVICNEPSIKLEDIEIGMKY